jgi:2-phosphoglycerate kinase
MTGILIGGSSCVGKTRLAAGLAAQLSLKHVETDRTLPRSSAMRPLDGATDVWDRPVEELLRLLVVAAEAAVPYLVEQAVALSVGGGGWVLEGERVHPELVERMAEDGVARGVFIVETDALRLHTTLLERLPGFKCLMPSRQYAVAELDRQYNLWLMKEADRRGLCVLPSQPWQTLSARVASSLEERGRRTRG